MCGRSYLQSLEDLDLMWISNYVSQDSITDYVTIRVQFVVVYICLQLGFYFLSTLFCQVLNVSYRNHRIFFLMCQIHLCFNMLSICNCSFLKEWYGCDIHMILVLQYAINLLTERIC